VPVRDLTWAWLLARGRPNRSGWGSAVAGVLSLVRQVVLLLVLVTVTTCGSDRSSLANAGQHWSPYDGLVTAWDGLQTAWQGHHRIAKIARAVGQGWPGLLTRGGSSVAVALLRHPSAGLAVRMAVQPQPC
jgi:hypothetical protein